MITTLALLFPVSAALLVHARVDERMGFELGRMAAAGLDVRPTGAPVFISTEVRVKLVALRISPSGEFVLVFGRHLPDRKGEMWMFDSRTLHQIGHHVFSSTPPVPHWISRREAALQGAGTKGQALVASLGQRAGLTFSSRPGIELPTATNGSVGEQTMAELGYLWPASHNSRPDFGSAQFENHQGQAVISGDGKTILTCVEDDKSPTKSKSIILENLKGTWVEHRLGNHAWATFTLFGEVFSLYDSPSRRVALYDKETRRQLGMVQCDVHDLGPLLK